MTVAAGDQLLALDTATSRTIVAVGDGSGARAVRTVERAGPPLLDAIDDVLSEAGIGLADIAGVVVGTGPGSFTGLRVGLATAKTIAYARSIALFGVSTTQALARAVGSDRPTSVVLPAGARDHYLARVVAGQMADPIRLVPPGADLRAEVGEDVAVAIDLEGEPLGADATRLGAGALEGLAGALLAIGAERAATGDGDDVADARAGRTWRCRGASPRLPRR